MAVEYGGRQLHGPIFVRITANGLWLRPWTERSGPVCSATLANVGVQSPVPNVSFAVTKSSDSADPMPLEQVTHRRLISAPTLRRIRSVSSGSVGGVEAINDLITIYSAGGTVIVTEILAHPWAERQPLKAVLRDSTSWRLKN